MVLQWVPGGHIARTEDQQRERESRMELGEERPSFRDISEFRFVVECDGLDGLSSGTKGSLYPCPRDANCTNRASSQ